MNVSIDKENSPIIQKSLHFITAATVLALPLVTLSVQSVLAQTQSVTFTLINNTGRTPEEFYASSPSTNDWEEDILGVDVLPPGESVKIIIDDGREDCLYDFKGVLGASEDGKVGAGVLIQSALSVCDGGTYEYSE